MMDQLDGYVPRYAVLLHCHIAILSHRMWKPAAATLLTLLLQSRLSLSTGYVSGPGSDNLVSKFQRMSAPNSSRKASHDQSSFSNHPKKRLRPEAETGQDNSAMDMKFIQKLRLEAIFHPKFENENSSQEIRSKMLDLVAAQKGYLEVTLKHSGSLVLWSGGQRFYSKNSLSNQFTLVAEILLRQHMERAWRNVDGTGVEKYDHLSQFLSNRRLNVAFEVVTSVLGDHGDIPNKDFLIVTAIADRSKERFLSTTETLELCQKFRLPHNDVWTFTSGAQDLFLLYNCCRETGLATDTIDALSESAQAHIVSMYPHTAFQGDILEGFIIRYIGNPQKDQVRSMQERLRAMAETAQKIFAEVPPSLPTSFEISNLESPVLQTDVRKVFDQVDGPLLGINATEAFVEALDAVISSQDGENRRKAVKARVKNYDLPSATKALTLSDDMETRRLAEMLQTLGSLNKAINYTVIDEYLTSCSARTLCIINVHHDKTFRKYQKEKDANAMNLFRGFCIELGDASQSSLNDAEVSEMESGEQDKDDGPFLMLKMKLLPYMIRTFLCRNKLDLIQQNGPEAFVVNASKQLESWSISPQAKAKWLPFLQEWAIYAKGQLEGTLVSKDLPSLSSFSYLRHLNRFQTQYDSGELPTLEKYTKNNFSGFVYVISLTEAVAKTAADSIAQHVGCPHVMALRDAVKQCKMRAVVCHGIIHDYNNAVKQFLVDVQSYSTLVLIGCSENDIETEYENIKEQKGTKAKCSRWKEQPSPLSCIILLKSTNLDTDVASPEDSGSMIEVIKEAAKKAPWNGTQWDSRPGVLVFFLGIPGCGKSSLLGSKEDLFGESMLIKASNSTEKDRKIDIFVGDELGKNMWNVVTRHRSKESPSAITIMDKNTPPPSWPIVGQLCSSTRATPLAVFPDASSLKTTRIIGMRMPDGSFNPDRSHFYPFSLEYLALSMARVLERPSGTHKGKLDSGTEMAAMIVVKFYSFYRYKAADSLRDDIDRQLKANGVLDSLPPMEVPILKEDNVALPAEVSEVLKEALQLQVSALSVTPPMAEFHQHSHEKAHFVNHSWATTLRNQQERRRRMQYFWKWIQDSRKLSAPIVSYCLVKPSSWINLGPFSRINWRNEYHCLPLWTMSMITWSVM